MVTLTCSQLQALPCRSLLRVIPIGLVFLIPNVDSNSTILPAEMLTSRISEGVDTEKIEMTALISDEA